AGAGRRGRPGERDLPGHDPPAHGAGRDAGADERVPHDGRDHGPAAGRPGGGGGGGPRPPALLRRVRRGRGRPGHRPAGGRAARAPELSDGRGGAHGGSRRRVTLRLSLLLYLLRMPNSLLVGAVAYHPRVVTVWEGFRPYFVERGLDVDYVLYSNY